jgi:hypothetical protein
MGRYWRAEWLLVPSVYVQAPTIQNQTLLQTPSHQFAASAIGQQ